MARDVADYPLPGAQAASADLKDIQLVVAAHLGPNPRVIFSRSVRLVAYTIPALGAH